MELIKKNILGIFGLIILCVGVTIDIGILKHTLNITGIILLIIYAWINKDEFFCYLELVVLMGTIMKIMDFSNNILVLLLVCATIISLIKIFKNPIYRKLDTAIGLTGLFGLVYGYSTLNNYGYAIGGVSLAIYSIIGYFNGVKSALIFAILNIFFGSVAIYMILN